jgi:ATP-binding cassette, subfamily B, bacterial PglK
MNFIQKIFFLIDKKKIEVFLISFLLTISSILEVLGIGVIVSFVSLMLGTDETMNNKIENFIIPLVPKEIDVEPLYLIGFFLIIIFFIKIAIVISINFKIEKFSKIIEFNLKEKLLKNFIFLPDNLYSKQNTSKKIETIVRLTQIFQGPCLVSLLKFLSAIIQFIAIFTLLFFTNEIITLIIVIVIFFTGLIYTKVIKPYSKKYLKDESIASKNLIQTISEITEGISELKIYGKTNFFFNKFLIYSKEVFKNSLNSSILFFVIKPSLELMIVVFFVAITLILHSNSIYFENYFATFTIFVLSLIRILPVTTESISSFNRLISSKYAVDTIYDNIKELFQGDENEKKEEDKNFVFEDIKFKNVNFSYEPKNMIIKNLNFKINKNTFVGISGKSGSGKTTLVNIIMGKLEQTDGEVKINSDAINKNKISFQKKISYIQQNSFLFEGTLAENISLSKDFDQDKLNKSLEQSELISFYNANKNKTFGERGVLLSGGQKQRVSIARAFYHDRDILILDEFTNQLDHKTEENILDYVLSLKKFKTIILITHNYKLLENCDQVINL